MNNVKVGTLVDLLSPRLSERDEYTYSEYKVIEAHEKKGYIMYLCENTKTRVKTSFTSKDINQCFWKKPLVKIKE